MENPRIYVASLSDYNNGRLEGKWFDLSDYSNGSELMDGINEMLEEITEKYNDGEVREEWAVHDYEYIPSSLASEYMGENEFQQIYDIMEASENSNIPFEVLIERVGDVGSDDYGNIAESLVLVVDGNDETDIVFDLEQQMGALDFSFWQNHIYIDDVTERVMYGEDVDNFREEIESENSYMDEDEIERLAEERADEQESRRNDDLIGYLEDNGYSDIPSFVSKDYESAWNDLSMDYDVINYEDKMYVFSNNYGFGGGLLVGSLVGAYLGYKVGKYNKQVISSGFQTEKRIGKGIKNKVQGKKTFDEGGGIDSVKWVKTFEEDDVDKQYPFYVAQYQGFELTLYQNYNKIWGIVIEKDGKVVLRRGEWVYSLKEAKDSAIDFADEINNKFVDGGGVGRERFNLSFNYNPSNVSNEDAEKIVNQYTNDWKHNNDFDNVSFYVFNLTKEKADELKALLKMEDVFNIEIQKSNYVKGGGVGLLQYIDTKYSLIDAENEVEKLKKSGKYRRVQARKNVYPTHTPKGKDKKGNSGTFWRIYAQPIESYDEGGNVDTISDEDLLRIKLAVSEAENRIKANDTESNSGGGIEGITKFIKENPQVLMMLKKGGSVGDENYEMLKIKVTELLHHSKELQEIVKKKPTTPAWVIAKSTRASTDLSDITHYLDGKSQMYVKGGGVAKNGIDWYKYDGIYEAQFGNFYLYIYPSNERGRYEVVVKDGYRGDTISQSSEEILGLDNAKEFAIDIVGDYMKGFKKGGGVGEKIPYILWVSKDGRKREYYGEYKSMKSAERMARKMMYEYDGVYKSVGVKSKSNYEESNSLFDEGGVVFTDYNGSSIMYEPNYEEYFVNDEVFYSMEEAKNYIDNGSGKLKRDTFNVLSELYNLRDKGFTQVQLDGFNESIGYVIALRLNDTEIEKVGNNAYITLYKKGGGVYNRSWHQDHKRFNKSEDYEIPLNKRKFVGGGEVGNKENTIKEFFKKFGFNVEDIQKDEYSNGIEGWIVFYDNKNKYRVIDYSVAMYLIVHDKTTNKTDIIKQSKSFNIDNFDNGGGVKGMGVDFEKVKKADEIYREHNRERISKGIENFSEESVELWNKKYDDRLNKLNLTYEEKSQLNPKNWYANGGGVNKFNEGGAIDGLSDLIYG